MNLRAHDFETSSCSITVEPIRDDDYQTVTILPLKLSIKAYVNNS